MTRSNQLGSMAKEAPTVLGRPRGCSSGTWTWTYQGSVTVTGTIAKIITVGGTGGLSYAPANTPLIPEIVILKENECGYFTFLLLLQETWFTTLRTLLRHAA